MADRSIHDFRSAMRTDMAPKAMLAAGLPRQGVFGGGGRYNVSLAHGDAELNELLVAVGAVLDEGAARGLGTDHNRQHRGHHGSDS